MYPPLSVGHQVFGKDYCSGYVDKDGKWNTGFYCPGGTGGQVYCCGSTDHKLKYCCTGKEESSVTHFYNDEEEESLLLPTEVNSTLVVVGQDETSSVVSSSGGTFYIFLAVGAGLTAALLLIVLLSCFYCQCWTLLKNKRGRLSSPATTTTTSGSSLYGIPPPSSSSTTERNNWRHSHHHYPDVIIPNPSQTASSTGSWSRGSWSHEGAINLYRVTPIVRPPPQHPNRLTQEQRDVLLRTLTLGSTGDYCSRSNNNPHQGRRSGSRRRRHHRTRPCSSSVYTVGRGHPPPYSNDSRCLNPPSYSEALANYRISLPPRSQLSISLSPCHLEALTSPTSPSISSSSHPNLPSILNDLSGDRGRTTTTTPTSSSSTGGRRSRSGDRVTSTMLTKTFVGIPDSHKILNVPPT